MFLKYLGGHVNQLFIIVRFHNKRALFIAVTLIQSVVARDEYVERVFLQN